eukprot:403361399
MERLNQIEEIKEQPHPKVAFKYLEEKPQDPLLEVIQNKNELRQKYYYPKGDNLLMFYNHTMDHSEFGNFFDAPIELEGKIWPTRKDQISRKTWRCIQIGKYQRILTQT